MHLLRGLMSNLWKILSMKLHTDEACPVPNTPACSSNQMNCLCDALQVPGAARSLLSLDVAASEF